MEILGQYGEVYLYSLNRQIYNRIGGRTVLYSKENLKWLYRYISILTEIAAKQSLIIRRYSKPTNLIS